MSWEYEYGGFSLVVDDAPLTAPPFVLQRPSRIEGRTHKSTLVLEGETKPLSCLLSSPSPVASACMSSLRSVDGKRNEHLHAQRCSTPSVGRAHFRHDGGRVGARALGESVVDEDAVLAVTRQSPHAVVVGTLEHKVRARNVATVTRAAWIIDPAHAPILRDDNVGLRVRRLAADDDRRLGDEPEVAGRRALDARDHWASAQSDPANDTWHVRRLGARARRSCRRCAVYERRRRRHGHHRRRRLVVDNDLVFARRGGAPEGQGIRVTVGH